MMAADVETESRWKIFLKVDASKCSPHGCTLFSCICRWRRVCSPRIPRVAPDRDYLCIPAGADNSPEWSLLVGFLSDSDAIISKGSLLGLHRFRVARSGLILGESEDSLDILVNLPTIPGFSGIASASAVLTPDGRSLCLFSEHLDPGKVAAIPRVHQLGITYKDSTGKPLFDEERSSRYIGQLYESMLPIDKLPPLPPDCPTTCRPVSAAGHLWAPNIKLEIPTGNCFLGMLRLDWDSKRWEKAGSTFTFPIKREELDDGRWGGPLFQGYAVLHNDTILVSLRADQGFLTFNCSDCTWTEVTTTEDTHALYIPILGCGVYIEKDDTEQEEEKDGDDGSVYFLRDNRIFAYKLCYCQDQKAHRRKLKLEPPAMIDIVCPFYEEGYGFLTHLGGRLMCSVWINARLRCPCRYLHVLISTFRVRSTSAGQKGIDILHSTCRRLDGCPGLQPINEFCFLLEYQDRSPIGSSVRDGPAYTFPDIILEPSKMLDCCSNYLSELGCYKFEEPPKDPALEINRDLYIICKAKHQLIVYVAKINNGRVGSHGELLTRKYSLSISDDSDGYRVSGQPLPWHLVFGSVRHESLNIYAISSNRQDDVHVYNLKEESEESELVQCTKPTADLKESKLVRWTKPTADPLCMVLEVGGKIVALSNTLRVFYRDGSSWVDCRRHAYGSFGLNGNANLSGYVILDDVSFIVSDADTGLFLSFDMLSETWRPVQRTSPGFQLLNGRSVFVDGFIYTCTSGGLLAYELLKKGRLLYLGDPILLQFSWKFSWQRSWVAERMCLDCADKIKFSDAIIFCVVQGEYCNSKSLPGSLSMSHDVHITTVRVKTTSGHSIRKPERIDHMDIGTCFIKHDAALVCTKSCFAV